MKSILLSFVLLLPLSVAWACPDLSGKWKLDSSSAHYPYPKMEVAQKLVGGVDEYDFNVMGDDGGHETTHFRADGLDHEAPDSTPQESTRMNVKCLGESLLIHAELFLNGTSAAVVNSMVTKGSSGMEMLLHQEDGHGNSVDASYVRE